jgi:hypothetical protein
MLPSSSEFIEFMEFLRLIHWHLTYYVNKTSSLPVFRLASSKTKCCYIIILTFWLNTDESQSECNNISALQNIIPLSCMSQTLSYICFARNSPISSVYVIRDLFTCLKCINEKHKECKIVACGQPYQWSATIQTTAVEINFVFNFRCQEISFW